MANASGNHPPPPQRVIGRRIFNAPGGTWSNYQSAPWLATSSEYFYKPNLSAGPQGVRYVGFRGADGWALTAPVRLKHLDDWLVFKPSRTDAEGYTSAYASDWVELPSVGDITTATRALGNEVVSGSPCRVLRIPGMDWRPSHSW